MRVLFLAASLLSLAEIAAGDSLHTFPLRHRPAAEIVPVIEKLLGPGEGISGSGYQIFLRASESRRREMERLIASLDVAVRQLTVTVRQTVASNAHESSDGVSGTADVGSRGRVTIPDAANPGSRSRDGLRYRFERRESSANEQHAQTLRVQDGQHAFIRLGQSVPIVERVLTLTGRRSNALAEGLRYENFTTGFDVLPRVRGDRVLVEITPKLARPDSTADGLYRFQELRTTVSARLGEWIDLGTVVGESSEVNRAILQSARSEAGESVRVTLKVE